MRGGRKAGRSEIRVMKIGGSGISCGEGIIRERRRGWIEKKGNGGKKGGGLGC